MRIFLLATVITLSFPAYGRDVTLASVLAEHTYAIELSDKGLSGPGAERLLADAADTQFVLLAEAHNNRDIPRFTTALFRALHEAHDYRYFATEQDPLMMQRVSEAPVRGDYDRVSALAKQYPKGFTFISDEELQMLAAIGDISSARGRPIWGAEQAFGVTHYLDELEALAPGDRALGLLEDLRSESAVAETQRDLDASHYISDGADLAQRLEALRAAFAPRPGSRPAFLLQALQRSNEIYGYYHRAREGETVGLYNNTVREAYMKQRFVEEYRLAEAVESRLPKVLLKYGAWHLFHGRGPGNAYTLGNFTHEFALANRMHALGIFTLPYENADELAQWPGWIEPFVRDAPAAGWDLIALAPLRVHAHARKFDGEFAAEHRDMLYRLVFGFEYLLRMPASGPASYGVTGWEY